MIHACLDALRAIRRQQAGVALIEFALGLPVLIMILMGGMELLNLVVAHQKVSRIATTTADLAARYRASIDEADIGTLMLGAQLSAQGIDFAGDGRIILSSITRNVDDDGHWIRWQRCDGGLSSAESEIGEENEGKDDASIADIEGLAIQAPSNVMYAEVTYLYKPEYAPWLISEREIRYRSAFIARELSLNNITNLRNLSGSDLKLCD